MMLVMTSFCADDVISCLYGQQYMTIEHRFKLDCIYSRSYFDFCQHRNLRHQIEIDIEMYFLVQINSKAVFYNLNSN